LATTIFVWGLAVVFYFSKIPEISDADMQEQMDSMETLVKSGDKPLIKQYRLFLAVWAQFMYVGAEGSFLFLLAKCECLSQHFSSITQMRSPDSLTQNHPISCLLLRESSPSEGSLQHPA